MECCGPGYASPEVGVFSQPRGFMIDYADLTPGSDEPLPQGRAIPHFLETHAHSENMIFPGIIS